MYFNLTTITDETGKTDVTVVSDTPLYPAYLQQLNDVLFPIEGKMVKITDIETTQKIGSYWTSRWVHDPDTAFAFGHFAKKSLSYLLEKWKNRDKP